MKNKTISYFPEPPPEKLYPQLLAVEHQGKLYKLQVETFHLYENAVSAQNLPEHSHEVFHIVQYRAGDNTFKLDGRQCSSHPGTLVLVPPGVPHCFSPMLPGGSVYHEVTFSLVWQGRKLIIPFTGLFSKYYGCEIKTGEMLVEMNASLDTQIENIYFELNDDFSKYDSANSFPVYQHLGDMFYLLFENIFCLKEDESLKPHAESRLQKARTRIEQKLHAKLSLKDLAETAGMSPEHFCREFRKVYNEPPLEMRNRLRISAAMKLIQYSDRPIKQIAEELGYSDIYHFSKAFKKQTGISPGRFRNK
jgi:AraC-like DNA-binding protein/mannose-6-phosphate isomerase-like protein (cupin superfamily)